MPRTLFIDMPSGIAGDMLLGALVGCGADIAALNAGLATLEIGVALHAERVLVGGLDAWKTRVDAPQEAQWIQAPTFSLGKLTPTARVRSGAATGSAVEQPSTVPHRPYRDIRDLLHRASLSPLTKERAQAVFRLLAEAEAEVHGTTPEDIQFHEVGSADAMADIVGCCLALEQLGVERIIASSLLPGHGTVRCAHGRMPVPVPAVARMLARTLPRSGVRPPWTAVDQDTGELTTPTGAALVCALADAFRGAGAGRQSLRAVATGFGAGTKVIPGFVNVVRCLLADEAGATPEHDTVVELACQVDDATPEHLAVALEDLLAAGALDAWLTPIVMKKGRAAHQLGVLCRLDDQARLTALVLQKTPTLGVRSRLAERTILPRTTATVDVLGQSIRLKIATLPDGTTRAKPEADDLAAAARHLGLAYDDVARRALATRSETYHL